mgnify:CR=1 FL=1
MPELTRAGEWQAEDYLEHLGWSGCGNWLAVGAPSGPLYFLEPSSNQWLARPGHGQGLTGLAWQSIQGRLATCGLDGRVRLWTPTQQEAEREIAGPDSWLSGLAWSQKSGQLAVIGGRYLDIFDSDLNLLQRCGPHSSTLAEVAWLPHSARAITTGYMGLQAWQVGSSTPATEYRWKGSSLALAISPNEKYIATGDQDCTVHFWKTRRPFEEESCMMSGFPSKVTRLDWDSTSRYLATAGASDATLWDCSAPGPADRAPLVLGGDDRQFLTALRFRPKSLWLAGGNEEGDVFLWEPTRSRQPLLRQEAGAPITQLAWCPRGETLAVATAQGLLQLWRFCP